ncbi:HlyD family type I secretion periplasmic adaptor subunit [Xenorhabdus bovienii]|uniref:HlyD family type I secretion periplasmic adaptor subunit n=1 Tax=Xenorhabdus bovienii TaxID=40576 RepID=UPI00237C7033|nr:HlyD family type I secretion periplasmic adaptor subunit [Xenorhabdus bovienii]MDE1475889.1 HlyD family type I secretion periplasmic adaptor subunit [Xenorhabdus bovienii]
MKPEKASIRPLSPTLHVTILILITLFVFILLGSIFTNTEIVARGRGKIIPVSRLQQIQPQTSGKIYKIYAREGQTVKAGSLLVELDRTQTQNDIKQIEAEIDKQNLEATIAISIITPLETIDPKTAAFVEQGLKIFHQSKMDKAQDRVLGKAVIKTTLIALQDRILELKAQQKSIEKNQHTQNAKIDKIRTDKDIVQQKLDSAATLVKKGTISRIDYLNRLRELKAIENEMTVALRELDAIDAQLNVLERQRTSTLSSELAKYRKKYRQTEISLSGLQASLNSAKNRLDNLSLYAPVNGRVENLAIHTIGRFVNAGETLMTIIPSHDALIIEAFFDNRDIGFMETSQKAYIKFDAFPSERFGVVTGSVISIGADARQDTAFEGKYAVRLRLDQNGIVSENKQIGFIPGMGVTVDVITAKRRLISYFFEPIIKAIQDGLKER